MKTSNGTGGSPSRVNGEGQKATGSQAIDRALSIIRCFGDGRAELGLSQISEELNLNPSTTHRIARALVRRGFLTFGREAGAYRLGGIAALVGEAARRHFGLERAIRVLEDIADKHQDSVSLGVREGDVVGVLHRIESKRELRFSQKPGSQVMLHASAMGKAMLFGAPQLRAEIASLGRLSALTEHTIVDPDVLAREISRSVERGYTVDNQEQVIGVRCVGAPIRDRKSVVRAAFAIQAPAALLDERRIEEIGKQMSAYSNRLSEAMGF
ncbi:MAG: IclR family transcriptional regulator [Rhizobiaceae bacterium]|nr:IclR family transcriptional regulator [Rhizobiaceae bacterium]